MNVDFIPSSKLHELVVPHPKIAKNFIPDWYKNKKMFYPNNTPTFNDGGKVDNFTVKACVPFHDAMTSGYIQETWSDIWIENTDNEIRYVYSREPKQIDHRNYTTAPIDKSFYQMEFLWIVPWIPKLPKGYSMMFLPPVNHFELPFYAPTGIIDSDVFYHSFEALYPFWIKEGFSGIIPAGTPMFQMIPIKRDNWRAKKKRFEEDFYIKHFSETSKKFWGIYKSIFHQKKIYELEK